MNAPWIEPTVLYTCDPGHESSYEQAISEHDAVFVREQNFEMQTRAFLYGRPKFMWLVDDGVFYQPTPEPTDLPWSHRRPGCWQWRDHHSQSEEGYPLAVCDTVYQTDTVTPLLEFTFDNPNALERGMHARRYGFTPLTVYGGEQTFCTVEHNAVSRLSVNPTMGGDIEDLRLRYLAGQRISLADVGTWTIDKAHVQFEYRWDDP